MSIFNYKAKTKKGKIKEGSVVADSKVEAGRQIKDQGLAPLFVKEAKSVQKRKKFLAGGLPLIEKANFCRYMAAMIKSGLPLSEAVEVLSAEINHPAMQKILDDVRSGIQKGQFLSNAFARHPQVFDNVFLTLIKAGEDSGTLEQSFEYLGKQLYADYELSQKIKSTLAYPVVVTMATMGLGLGLLVFVVPKISPVLLRLSDTFPLPAHTMVILKIGLFLSKNILFFLVGLGALGTGLVMFLASRRGRELLVNILSRLPVIKDFYTDLAITRFSRTLSTLLKSGVSIVSALEVSSGMLKLPRFKKVKGLLTEQVGQGRQLSEVLKETQLFPPIMTSMIMTGEKTATLDKLLFDLAVFYEEKVSNSLKTMTDLIEPLLMLAIGLGVGAVVVSLIAPIYSFVGSLSMSVGGS
ncbi:type II secretion system F family protein [Patescibacteria group bacterium]